MIHENKQVYELQTIIQEYQKDESAQISEKMVYEKYKSSILNKAILDIGCGTGRTTASLKEMTNQYLGIDYSEKMIAACRQRFPDESFRVMDAREMTEFKEGQFDFILFSFNGLDYLDHEARLKALTEIYRVLKKGGLFVFSSHNRDFQYKDEAPRFGFCRNPFALAKNFFHYVKDRRMHAKMKKKQVLCEEYAIINDLAHHYRLMTYYIDNVQQTRQLQALGFEVLERYGCMGQVLAEDQRNVEPVWIYYVTRKP